MVRESRHAPVVSELLSKGATITTPTADGWLPLHMACVEGEEEVFGLLLGAVLAASGEALNTTTPEVSVRPRTGRSDPAYARSSAAHVARPRLSRPLKICNFRSGTVQL